MIRIVQTQTLSVSVIVQAAPAPVLVVGAPAIDFGSIDAEKTAQQTFTITNTGTAPLEITGIESDVSGLTFDPVMFTLSPDSSADDYDYVSQAHGGRVFG